MKDSSRGKRQAKTQLNFIRAHSVNASSMSSFISSKRTNLLPRLAIKENGLSISSTRTENLAIRRISNNVHKTGMFLNNSNYNSRPAKSWQIMKKEFTSLHRSTHRERVLEPERRTFVIPNMFVFTSSDHSEGPHWTIINGIDKFGVTDDISHGTSRVPQKDMPIPEKEE